MCKRDVDDFLQVLRWSKEFGVNTENVREIKQGIIGVFAGSAFNPRENVHLKGGTTISLATYANRVNTQLLKAADFNCKLHERGIPLVSVQKICKVAKDEEEVRQMLDAVWKDPKCGKDILFSATIKNKEIYDFENMLNEKTADWTCKKATS